MKIENHVLTVGEYQQALPHLSSPATVHVWRVPVAYRAVGYYVSVQETGGLLELPACAANEMVYQGSANLEPADDAILAAAKADKLDEIAAACDAALAPLETSYPAREVKSWPQQITEAALVAADASLADPPPDPLDGWADKIPLLRTMAAARPSLGETSQARILELARRILANAAAWSAVAGPIIGKRQALEDVVTDADATLADVRAIEVEFT